MDEFDERCELSNNDAVRDTCLVSELFDVNCKSEPLDSPETDDESTSAMEFGKPEEISGLKIELSNLGYETEVSEPEYPKNKTKIRKIKRNSGLAYVTKNGKKIKKRESKELENCKKRCKQKISKELREKCFAEYWSLGTYSERLAYASKRIQIDKKSRITNLRLPKKQRNYTCKYSIIDDHHTNIDVCKGCYLNIYDETHGFISSIIKKNSTGLDLTDFRGQFVSIKKITNQQKLQVESHINSFPVYESHYTSPHNSKKLYLPEGLNLTKMYDLYQEKFDTSKVSYTKYREIFNSCNLKFNKSQSDKCTKCLRFDTKIQIEQSVEARNNFIYQKYEHNDYVDTVYKTLQLDKADPKKTVLCIDLQPNRPTPYLKCSTDFYKRKLWVFHLTIRNCDDNSTHCFVWNETISAREANQVASCLLKYLNNLSTLKRHIVIYSNTCAQQIRNIVVASMFQYLMATCVKFDILEHKFLEPGHMHLECDSDRCIIEKKIESSNILLSHPHDWAQLFRTCGGKQKFNVVEMGLNDFLDFVKLQKQYFKNPLKNQQQENIVWPDIRILRYTKGNCDFIAYKTCYRDSCFKTMVTKKSGSSNFKLQQLNYTTLAISDQKKADLLDLFEFIPQVFHNYYHELKTTSTMKELCYIEEESDCDENSF